MPTTGSIKVSRLSLDLHNFRTVPQPDEVSLIEAMILSSPEKFWGLMESLIDENYHPTENVIVLKEGRQLVVKEGNRRVGALKLALGLIPLDGLDVPSNIVELIRGLPASWKKENSSVPCALYPKKDAAVVDKLVARTHGFQGDKAGRDKWNAVAKARHNREMNGGKEPGLDLLEAFLNSNSKDIRPEQKSRWSANYPLTVLDDAIARWAPLFGASDSTALVKLYPKMKGDDRKRLDALIRDVGMKLLTFAGARDPDTPFDRYKFPRPATPPGGKPTAPTAKPTKSASGKKTTKVTAYALQDHRAVKATLQNFSVLGHNRAKVVTLLQEALLLYIPRHRHAFCFVLRSMFELSAKAYCMDHAATAGGPKSQKADNTDRNLVDVLRDVCTHMTNNNKDAAMKKKLHGAMAELAKPDGMLSITSMNQLVHHPSFSVHPKDISVTFSNLFPLLEAMNS